MVEVRMVRMLSSRIMRWRRGVEWGVGWGMRNALTGRFRGGRGGDGVSGRPQLSEFHEI